MNTALSPGDVAVRWFEEVWNDRNPDTIFELVDPDAKAHLEGGQELMGPQQIAEFQKTMLTALPDMRVEIVHLLSDDIYASVHWVVTGKHTGSAMGLSPTGREIVFRGSTWMKVIDGKLVEGWDCWDFGGVMSALASGTPVAPSAAA